MRPSLERRIAALERIAAAAADDVGRVFLYGGAEGPSPEQAAEIQAERDAGRPVFLIELVGLQPVPA